MISLSITPEKKIELAFPIHYSDNMDIIDIVSNTQSPRESRRNYSRKRSSSQRSTGTRSRARSLPRHHVSPRSVAGPINKKNRGFFGSIFGRSSSSSVYRRSPRSGFISRAFKKLRQLLRDLLYHMKREPYKVLMLVVIPLLLSGTFSKLLAKFGVRLPSSLQKALKIAARISRL